ncbi:MAG: hypothetical protein WC315_06150 [Candidatus Omnitrophota bacterium]|jgi:hypothetical protein
MNNKLPWKAHFYGTIDKRGIRDAERHTVNVYDTACAEFIVTAVNAHAELVKRVKDLEGENTDLRNVIIGIVPLLPLNVKKRIKDVLIKD